MRGIARNAFHTLRRALPSYPFFLGSFFDVLECNGDPRSPSLSVSNIVPKSAKSFRRHLTLGDVAIASHGLLVTLQFTKTIQFGGRHLHIFLLAVIPCFSLFTHDSFSPRTLFLSRVFHFRSQGPRSAYKT